jgi:uncharacterized protein YecT (DUF1311 family)
MKKFLPLLFFFIIFNLTGCGDKKNELEVKPSQNEPDKVSKYKDAEDECMKSAGTVNNTTVFGCAQASVEMAEKDMNILLEKIYIKLKEDEEAVDALKEYQAAWEVYLEAEVKFQSREIGILIQGQMTYEGISERIDYLNNVLKEFK